MNEVRFEDLSVNAINAVNLLQAKIYTKEIEISTTGHVLLINPDVAGEEIVLLEAWTFLMGMIIAHGGTGEEAVLGCQYASQNNWWGVRAFS